MDDTIFYIEHAEDIINIIKQSEDADEARKKMMKHFDILEYKANIIMRLRFAMFTKREIAEIKNRREEYMEIIAKTEQKIAEIKFNNEKLDTVSTESMTENEKMEDD